MNRIILLMLVLSAFAFGYVGCQFIDQIVNDHPDGNLSCGRLSEGVHTLTLTSVDLSGNKTVKTVTVYVTDGDTTVGKLIECGK